MIQPGRRFWFSIFLLLSVCLYGIHSDCVRLYSGAPEAFLKPGQTANVECLLRFLP
jgi:hypothetical protein